MNADTLMAKLHTLLLDGDEATAEKLLAAELHNLPEDAKGMILASVLEESLGEIGSDAVLTKTQQDGLEALDVLDFISPPKSS